MRTWSDDYESVSAGIGMAWTVDVVKYVELTGEETHKRHTRNS